MKKQLLFSSALLAAMAASANPWEASVMQNMPQVMLAAEDGEVQADGDFTSLIANADFSSAEGWMKAEGGGTTTTDMGLIGTLTINSITSVADETHTEDMYCAGISARWDTNFSSWQQTVNALPAGDYILTFDVSNPGNSVNYKMENLTYVQVGETKYYDEGMTAAALVGATGWVKHSIAFTVAEEGDVTISFGYKNNENMGGGTNGIGGTPDLFISNLQLKDALVGIKGLLAAEIAAAEAQLAGYDAAADYAVELAQAIAVAKAVSVTSAPEGQAAIDALKAAEAEAGLQALLATYAKIEDGTYYVKNNACGQFLQNGAMWGTRAVLGQDGIPYAISQGADGKYTLVSGVKGSAKALRPSDGFNDQSGAWELIATDGGFYMSNGTAYFSYDGTGIPQLVAEPTDASVWSVVTAEQRMADVLAAMETASEANPVDATYFIKKADFMMNDPRTAAWEGGEKIGGDGGSDCAIVTSGNSEKWIAGEFDVYQELAGLPAGMYKLTARAYYRGQGVSAASADEYENGRENTPVLYAGENKVNLVSVFAEAKSEAEGGWAKDVTSTAGNVYYIPNTQGNADDCFQTAYLNSLEGIEVGEDGTLRIGVKAEEGCTAEWVVFDQFKLTYLGAAAPATAELELGTDYSEDYSSCVVTVPEPAEGHVMLYTLDGEDEDAEWQLVEGPITVAYTEGRVEAGVCKFVLVVKEVEMDEEGAIVKTFAQGVEEISLVAPKVVPELGTAYNEDNSTCVVTATPTQEGTSFVISIDGGEEFMELPEEGYTLAWLEAMADEQGICIYNIVVKEVIYDEEYNMTEVSTVEEQIHLSKPLPVLELGTAYNEDNSTCVVTAEPTEEGTQMLISLDGGEEFMELPAEGYTIAWTPGVADEQGICVFNVVVREVKVTYDEELEMDVMETIIEGSEQVHLSQPLPVLELATAYNEDNSTCVVTAEPTEEGTQMLISLDGGEEFMELPAEGYTIAWTPGMADENGICVFNVVVREVKVTYDEELEMDVMETIIEGSEQVHLSKAIESMAGTAEDPIVLANGWSEEVAAAEVGADDAGYAHFTYTAEEDGVFVFSCGYEIKAINGLDAFESTQVRNAYGKEVKAGDVVEFSAYLPQSYEGVAYDEEGNEIEGETELYPINAYMFYAGVEAEPAVLYTTHNALVSTGIDGSPSVFEGVNATVDAYEDHIVIHGWDGTEGSDLTVYYTSVAFGDETQTVIMGIEQTVDGEVVSEYVEDGEDPDMNYVGLQPQSDTYVGAAIIIANELTGIRFEDGMKTLSLYGMFYPASNVGGEDDNMNPAEPVEAVYQISWDAQTSAWVAIRKQIAQVQDAIDTYETVKAGMMWASRYEGEELTANVDAARAWVEATTAEYQDKYAHQSLTEEDGVMGEMMEHVAAVYEAINMAAMYDVNRYMMAITNDWSGDDDEFEGLYGPLEERMATMSEEDQAELNVYVDQINGILATLMETVKVYDAYNEDTHAVFVNGYAEYLEARAALLQAEAGLSIKLTVDYNTDNSVAVVSAESTHEGANLVISIDGGEEFMELPAEGYQVAWLEAMADEQGICIYNVVVREVSFDEEWNMTVLAEKTEQIHLAKPVPAHDIQFAFNDDYSLAVVTAEPTEEDTEMLISIDGGEEWMELPAEGYTVAWLEELSDEQGICIYNIVVREQKTSYDEELEQYVTEIVCETADQLHLSKPLDADGIAAVGGNAQSESVFDMLGRKMKSIVKKGMYIINGKKVLVK